MDTLLYTSAWPAEWASQRRSGLLIVSTVIMVLVTAGMAAGAGARIVAGDPVSGIALLLVAVYTGHLTAIGVNSFRGGRPRRDTTGAWQEPTGVVFRYAAGPTYLLAAVLAMTTVGLILLGIFAAGDATARGYTIAAVAGLAAVFTAVFLGIMLKLAPGQID